MDDEKIRKQLEFILNTQAQFYIDSPNVQETGKQLQKIAKDSEKRSNTSGYVSPNLYNANIEQSKNIAKLAKNIKELRAIQKETNKRFDAVILRFEKFLDNQNGKKS